MTRTNFKDGSMVELAKNLGKLEDDLSHEDALNSVLSDHEELTYNQLVTMLEKYS